MWLVKPTIGMSGHESTTSSGSTRAMSTMTRSGGSTLSRRDEMMAVQKGLELPAEEEIDACEQDRRHRANLSATAELSYPEMPSASKSRFR